jgi:hypothetical protein
VAAHSEEFYAGLSGQRLFWGGYPGWPGGWRSGVLGYLHSLCWLVFCAQMESRLETACWAARMIPNYYSQIRMEIADAGRVV